MMHKSWSTLFAVVLVVAYSVSRECGAAELALDEEIQAELNAVEQQIAAKTAELAALRQKADALRAKLTERAAPKGLAGLQKILDEIPADSQPRGTKDDDGTIARSKANDWLKTNLPGKSIEFSVRLSEVKLLSGRDGKYPVHVTLHPSIVNDSNAALPVGTVRSGGADWKVFIWSPKMERHSTKLHEFYLDEAGARRLRAMNGKDMMATGIIAGRETRPFHYFNFRDPEFGLRRVPGNKLENRLLLYLDEFSLAGVEPK